MAKELVGADGFTTTERRDLSSGRHPLTLDAGKPGSMAHPRTRDSNLQPRQFGSASRKPAVEKPAVKPSIRAAVGRRQSEMALGIGEFAKKKGGK